MFKNLVRWSRNFWAWFGGQTGRPLMHAMQAASWASLIMLAIFLITCWIFGRQDGWQWQGSELPRIGIIQLVWIARVLAVLGLLTFWQIVRTAVSINQAATDDFTETQRLLVRLRGDVTALRDLVITEGETLKSKLIEQSGAFKSVVNRMADTAERGVELLLLADREVTTLLSQSEIGTEAVVQCEVDGEAELPPAETPSVIETVRPDFGGLLPPPPLVQTLDGVEADLVGAAAEPDSPPAEFPGAFRQRSGRAVKKSRPD